MSRAYSGTFRQIPVHLDRLPFVHNDVNRCHGVFAEQLITGIGKDTRLFPYEMVRSRPTSTCPMVYGM